MKVLFSSFINRKCLWASLEFPFFLFFLLFIKRKKMGTGLSPQTIIFYEKEERLSWEPMSLVFILIFIILHLNALS